MAPKMIAAVMPPNTFAVGIHSSIDIRREGRTAPTAELIQSLFKRFYSIF